MNYPAVRLLSLNPEEVVLRSADLLPGFSVSADNQTDTVNFATSTATGPVALRSRGMGYHVALAHMHNCNLVIYSQARSPLWASNTSE